MNTFDTFNEELIRHMYDDHVGLLDTLQRLPSKYSHIWHRNTSATALLSIQRSSQLRHCSLDMHVGGKMYQRFMIIGKTYESQSVNNKSRGEPNALRCSICYLALLCSQAENF